MITRLAAFVVLASLIALFVVGAWPAREVDFERDVRPIFRDHCFECHGPSIQEGSLRLDKKRYAFVGSGDSEAIVPGIPGRSAIYRRVVGLDTPQMPPETPLPAELIATLESWIASGAHWPDDEPAEAAWPVDPRVDALLTEIRRGNFAEVERAVRETPQLRTARGTNGVSLLHQTVLYGGPREVAWLLEQGANANAADRAGVTPLMLAVDDVEKVELLLQAGASPNDRSAAGRTALLNAVQQKRSAPVLRVLLAHGASVGGEERSDPLLQVLRNGDLEASTLLWEHYGRTFPEGALSQAALSNCLDCLHFVLSRERSTSAVTAALLASAIMANTEILAELVAAGADVNASDEKGRTVLMKAVYSDYADVQRIRLLLDAGADINARAKDGDTALTEARKKGNSDVLATLVAAGAKE